MHHGGIGSTAQGLAAGVPQLLMPLAHDQFDNAARLKQFGVGDWEKPSKFTTRAVTKKLGHLLESDAVRSHCEEIRNKLSKRDGLARAAAEIDGFADSNGG